MKNKRGMSDVIITILIVLLALVLMGIVWIMVKNVISKGTEDTSLNKFLIDLIIENAYIEGENIIIDIKRNPGQGNLEGIKFIFYNGSDSEDVEEMIILNELEEKSFSFNLDLLNLSGVQEISIASIYKSSSGKLIFGDIGDPFEIKEIKSCIPDCANKECGNDGCEGTCGSCSGEEECINGICELSDEIFCHDECNFENQKICSNQSFYKKCGDYDFDSCLEWSNNIKCSVGWSCEGKTCQYNLAAKQITLGQHYNDYPGTIYHTQATVEFIDLSNYQLNSFILSTDSKGYLLQIDVYKGQIDLGQWAGATMPLYSLSSKEINPDMAFNIPPDAEIFSIVYNTQPFADSVPENLIINRTILIKDPSVETDYSLVFVTDYSSFPDSILDNLDSPYEFNNDMNLAYGAMKDLVGEEPEALDDEGKLRLIVQDHEYCGLAGNPIRMAPICMSPDSLNKGHPGFGVVHELGHMFTCRHSYCWGDTGEAWANFIALSIYKMELFTGYKIEDSWEGWTSIKKYWDDVCSSPDTDVDSLQCFMLTLENQHGWEVIKNFFRKYIASDPAQTKDDIEKQKLIVQYLAESVRDITGKQTDYDYVVDYLVGKGFPSP